MDLCSGAEGTTGADLCGIRRSGVDSATGLTDFSWACLVAVVSIDCPGGAASAALSSHIVSLLMAGGYARKCIAKVTSELHLVARVYFINAFQLGRLVPSGAKARIFPGPKRHG